MSLVTSSFYVSHIETLLFSGCGFLLLFAVLRNHQDYSALQQWATNTPFYLFVGTVVLQLLLSTSLEEVEVEDESSEAAERKSVNQKTQEAMSALATAFCSVCFLVFVVLLVMFARSLPSGPNGQAVTQMILLPPNRSAYWYFHPANVSNETCDDGVWKTTLYKNTTCFNNQTDRLVRGEHSTLNPCGLG